MKMKKTKKIRNWLMAASGAAAITLSASGSSAMAVNTLQSQELKVASAISLPGLIANTPSSNDKAEEIKRFLKDFKIPDLIALIPIIVAVFSYVENERWKHRQYVDEKIKAFENQPETINVRKMLSAELQCVELFPFLDKHNERYVIVEDELWSKALLDSKDNQILRNEHDSIDTTEDDDFFHQETVKKAVIRDNFNRFLNDLQQFEKMIKSDAAKESNLRNYLDAWIERINQADNEIRVTCQVSRQEYSPKEVLLEYLGLTESNPKKDFSVVQADVRALIKRYRQLNQDGNLIEVKIRNEIWIKTHNFLSSFLKLSKIKASSSMPVGLSERVLLQKSD